MLAISIHIVRLTAFVLVFAGVLVGVRCEAIEVRLDRRTFHDVSGTRYFVAIVARTGSPTGHAFVVWGKQNAGRQLLIQKAWGYYPKNGVGLLGDVPHEIRAQAFNPRSSLFTDRVIVEVNRLPFERTQTHASRWSTNDSRLFSSHAINFVRAVAQGTNISVPAVSRSDVPSTHARKIIELNR